MKTGTSTVRTSAEAEKQLKGFIAKFEPKHQTRIRAVRKAPRKRFPTAYELAAVSQDELELAIKAAGFYRNKAKNLRAMAKDLSVAMIVPDGGSR